jgi:DNA polymerase I-like protein with 3'-5' exonuclease and polymerase domains
MMEAFQENPKLDLHEFAAQVITESTGIQLTRKATKNIAFGLLYGMGLGSMAERLGVTVDEAKKAKAAYLNTFPGIKVIQRELDRRGRDHSPMTTWGGRRYYAEDPRFAYRLFNYLIQGSSADITKEAVLRYNETKKHGRLLLTVHDQITISCPKKAWKEEMAILKDAMNGIELGAPLMSDGGVGHRWTELEDCE